MQIPDTVDKIGDYAFAECIGLKKVSVSENTNTADTAFYGCVSLNKSFERNEDLIRAYDFFLKANIFISKNVTGTPITAARI